jgi:class 3 adenylate cyclase
MAKIKLKYRQTDSGKYLYPNNEYRKFEASLLDMGDISRRHTATEALVSIFDLAGFTSFCDQRDPGRTVSEFLDKFLLWLFDKIKSRLDDRACNSEERQLLAPLPNFAKFTGDGVLFLWELRDDLASLYVYKIIEALRQVCDEYQWDFLEKIAEYMPHSPAGLRCGIAQGQVVSLGGGTDYVGSCLNLASRLANERNLSLVIAQKDINLEKNMHRGKPDDFVKKKTKIDGIAKEEYVYLLKKEFDALPKKEKRKFKDIAP